METSSLPAISPSRRTNEGLMSENESPQARVPRSQFVTSASPLPGSSIQMSTSPQAASARYVKQFQAFMEHQRQNFDEERALWNTERMELHEKIALLEGSLRQYQTKIPSQVSSPVKISHSALQNETHFRVLANKERPKHTSATTAGDEVWRGPKPDVQPTRTFSDPTTSLTKPGDPSRLPSIAEDTTCGRKDSSDMQLGFHKPSVSGAEIDKNLDGINFKSSILSPIPTQKVMTPQSPSPRTSSPPFFSPGAIELPPSRFEARLDLYTKDAGHTPRARHTDLDGASSDDNGLTPTQAATDRPPIESHGSSAKLPSERSDSYFPEVEDEAQNEKENNVPQKDEFEDAKDESRDEDPELKGPLGLDNSKGEDDPFLHELDSKLLQAARSEAFGPPRTGLDTEDPSTKDETAFEQPEHEPKLRIKRSMNFGSAFGAKTCGKDI